MAFNPYSKYMNKWDLIFSHTLLLPPQKSHWEVCASALPTLNEMSMLLVCNDNIQENHFWHWTRNFVEMRNLALLTARLLLHRSLLWPLSSALDPLTSHFTSFGGSGHMSYDDHTRNFCASESVKLGIFSATKFTKVWEKSFRWFS